MPCNCFRQLPRPRDKRVVIGVADRFEARKAFCERRLCRRLDLGILRERGDGPFAAGGEGAQAGIDADAGRPDRRLKILGREGQGAGARERAEQHRGNHAAGGIRDLGHVEGDEAVGGNVRCLVDLRRVGGAVAGRGLLDHGQASDAKSRSTAYGRARPARAGWRGRLPSIRRRSRCRPCPAPASATARGDVPACRRRARSSRCSRSWRRCAGRRRAPRSIARTSRAARPAPRSSRPARHRPGRPSRAPRR